MVEVVHAQSAQLAPTPNPSNLYEIAIVIDELKSSNLQKRVGSVRNLGRVAIALGQQRTRQELLPYLKEVIEDGDDEVLLELARILPEQLDLAGGVQYIMHILKPLETLCTSEELTVRE